MGQNITLTAADGFELGAYQADPEGTPRGGLVIIQEIFGVNMHIRDVCDKYAAKGFRVVAPALFDRIESGIDYEYTPELQAQGAEMRGQLDPSQPVMDVKAAVDYLKGIEDKVGVVGYCWGGTLAWAAAQKMDVLASVCYYGGAIHDMLDSPATCPVMMHFGEADAMIPMENVDLIRVAFPDIPIFTYADAGHGFNCNVRASYNEAGAKLAQERTDGFLDEHFG